MIIYTAFFYIHSTLVVLFLFDPHRLSAFVFFFFFLLRRFCLCFFAFSVKYLLFICIYTITHQFNKFLYYFHNYLAICMVFFFFFFLQYTSFACAFFVFSFKYWFVHTQLLTQHILIIFSQLLRYQLFKGQNKIIK